MRQNQDKSGFDLETREALYLDIEEQFISYESVNHYAELCEKVLDRPVIGSITLRVIGETSGYERTRIAAQIIRQAGLNGDGLHTAAEYIRQADRIDEIHHDLDEFTSKSTSPKEAGYSQAS